MRPPHTKALLNGVHHARAGAENGIASVRGASRRRRSLTMDELERTAETPAVPSVRLATPARLDMLDVRAAIALAEKAAGARIIARIPSTFYESLQGRGRHISAGHYRTND